MKLLILPVLLLLSPILLACKSQTQSSGNLGSKEIPVVTSVVMTDRDQNRSVSGEKDGPIPTNPCQKDCSGLAFDYIVINTAVKTPQFAEMEVFMDPKAFDSENLRSLFLHLAKKTHEPENLVIKVKTDWSQLRMLNSCGGSGATRNAAQTIIPKDENYAFHRAEFYRRGGNVFFYYTTRTGTEKMQKVVIAGTFQPKQRWELEENGFRE